MSKVIWKLTETETNDIKDIFEKKVALENLVKIIDTSNEKLYSKLTNDYVNVMSQFQAWWSKTSKKYSWEGENWSINFETNEVLIQ